MSRLDPRRQDELRKLSSVLMALWQKRFRSLVEDYGGSLSVLMLEHTRVYYWKDFVHESVLRDWLQQR